ncbi:ATP-binding protein [Candidatus Parcubacteria bacterium]|nr:ATP-binding protein [Candidatus Parcubacteria bacterium]
MLIKRKVLVKINQWLDSRKILILNGARQVGKTTILREIEKQLNKKDKNCVYLNIESFQVADRLNNNPDNIFDFISDRNLSWYILIDEIQILEQPSHFLKYIYDAYDNLKIIVTGSANLEIKAKLQDSLAGRKISFFINPLSIDEILDYEKLGKQTKNPFEQQKIDAIFKEYLLFGGLPEVYLEKNREKKEVLLKEYLGTYINKDIRALISDINVSKFNQINIALSHLIGNLVNKNKLANDININSRTLNRYLDLLKYSFIFDFISPYFSNPLTQIKKMQKVYCFDFGIRNAILNNFIEINLREDCGRLFENFVYLILKEKYQEINFWRTIKGSEVDFTYQENGLNIIEAKYKKFIAPKIEQSIRQAIKLLLPNKVKIVNLNLTKNIIVNKKEIEFIDWKKI